MSTVHGKDGAIYQGANQVAEITKFTIDEEIDISEDAAMGDEWKTHKTGLKFWTATIEAMWDPTDTNGQEALTVGASVTLNTFPEGNTNGKRVGSGTCTIKKVTTDVDLSTINARTLEVEGNGPLTWNDVS